MLTCFSSEWKMLQRKPATMTSVTNMEFAKNIVESWWNYTVSYDVFYENTVKDVHKLNSKFKKELADLKNLRLEINRIIFNKLYYENHSTN